MKATALKHHVEIGSLDQKIQIKEPVRSRTLTGSEEKNTYDLVKNRWANIKELTGTEDVDGMKLNFTKYFEFTFRYFAGMNTKYVIEHDGNDYNILDVTMIGRKRFLKVRGVHIE